MAKRMRRIVSMIIALALCFGIIATPAMAHGHGGGHGGGNQDSDLYEWYQVYVQGNLVASGQGSNGNVYYLGTSYKAGITPNGHMLTWYINPNGGNSGNFSGTVDLRNYITVPDGFTVKDYTIEESSIDGVNNSSSAYMYDNAIIKITISTIYNEETGEEIEIPDPSEASKPTEPSEPSEPPKPVETEVTVNHIYKTYDSYTGETVTDGTASSSEDATEGDSYTAAAVPSYKSNTYTQQTDNAALTITVKADAAENVIDIEYLRTIDTTPKPVETKVTVNHIYKTLDIYTGETVTDDTASSSEDATEGDSYTATAVPSYKGNTYTQQTDDAALTIVINADASKNVIDIEYLRTIDTTPINYTPVLEITKTADKAAYKAGDTITWTITVKNTSEFTAYDVAIADELTGESWSIDALAPGAEESFTATLKNAAVGAVKNIAVATWTDNDEIPDEEEPNEAKTTEDEEIVEVRELINNTPVLEVVKTAGKAAYVEGETLTWTITVKNTSEFTAYNVAVADELTGESWSIDALAPGAEESFTATLQNAAAGSVKNVAVVTWEDGDEIPDEEEPNETKTTEDEEVVEVEEPAPTDPAPVIRIVKTSNKYLFETGETIIWYISVQNISAYTAYNVVVTDELTNDYWNVGTLEPGAERTFTTATQTTEAGGITNVAVVTWTDGDNIPDNQETDEIKRGSDEAPALVQDPAPVVEHPVAPANDDIIIEEEDVPLAAAPKTGDISGILAAISLFSLGGMVLLNRKKDEE